MLLLLAMMSIRRVDRERDSLYNIFMYSVLMLLLLLPCWMGRSAVLPVVIETEAAAWRGRYQLKPKYPQGVEKRLKRQSNKLERKWKEHLGCRSRSDLCDDRGCSFFEWLTVLGTLRRNTLELVRGSSILNNNNAIWIKQNYICITHNSASRFCHFQSIHAVCRHCYWNRTNFSLFQVPSIGIDYVSNYCIRRVSKIFPQQLLLGSDPERFLQWHHSERPLQFYFFSLSPGHHHRLIKVRRGGNLVLCVRVARAYNNTHAAVVPFSAAGKTARPSYTQTDWEKSVITHVWPTGSQSQNRGNWETVTTTAKI